MQSFKNGWAPLTALIGYLNVVLEYFDDLKLFIARAQQTFGWAWALPSPPLLRSCC